MIILWLIVGALFVCFGLVVFRGAPYVPTHRWELKRALSELYPLAPHDVVVDVGSGDGVVLREASDRGARAIGYEINPILVYLSRWLSRRHEGVEVKLADFWLTDLPDETTVVYAFTVTRDIPKMIRKLQAHVERTGKPIAYISYGSSLTDREPMAQLGAHTLYQFFPLHQE